MKVFAYMLYKFNIQSYPLYNVKIQIKIVGYLWKIKFDSLEKQNIYGHALSCFL